MPPAKIMRGTGGEKYSTVTLDQGTPEAETAAAATATAAITAAANQQVDHERALFLEKLAAKGEQIAMLVQKVDSLTQQIAALAQHMAATQQQQQQQQQPQLAQQQQQQLQQQQQQQSTHRSTMPRARPLRGNVSSFTESLDQGVLGDTDDII